jgi:hypothetical protein
MTINRLSAVPWSLMVLLLLLLYGCEIGLRQQLENRLENTLKLYTYILYSLCIARLTNMYIVLLVTAFLFFNI